MIHFVKFYVIGIINTIAGYSVIFACMYWGGMNPFWSNVWGYMAGLCVSYLLNRKWNYMSTNPVYSELPRFLTVFVFSYLCNLGILYLALHRLHINGYVSQILAGIVYSLVFYGLSRWLVFQRDKKALP